MARSHGDERNTYRTAVPMDEMAEVVEISSFVSMKISTHFRISVIKKRSAPKMESEAGRKSWLGGLGRIILSRFRLGRSYQTPRRTSVLSTSTHSDKNSFSVAEGDEDLEMHTSLPRRGRLHILQSSAMSERRRSSVSS